MRPRHRTAENLLAAAIAMEEGKSRFNEAAA